MHSPAGPAAPLLAGDPARRGRPRGDAAAFLNPSRNFPAPRAAFSTTRHPAPSTLHPPPSGPAPAPGTRFRSASAQPPGARGRRPPESARVPTALAPRLPRTGADTRKATWSEGRILKAGCFFKH